MTPDDLEDGMIVETRDGEKFWVVGTIWYGLNSVMDFGDLDYFPYFFL